MITCDDCGTEVDRSVQEFSLANGGIRQALICPHCQRQYPIASISANGVRLRERLNRMRRMRKGHTVEYRELLDRYKKQVTKLATPDEAN